MAEAWSLAAAAAATTTAEAEVYAPMGHRATIVVTRYDRVEVDGTIARRHQEDLCQLSGLSSNRSMPLRDRSLDPTTRPLPASPNYSYAAAPIRLPSSYACSSRPP